MKCWAFNKNNPANKGKQFDFADYENYGDMSCIIGMISATSAVKKINRNKNRQEQGVDYKLLKERKKCY